jgi:hypothetical protein
VGRADLVLGAVVGAVVLVGTVVHAHGFHAADVKAYAMIALGAAALPAQRRFPVPAVLVAAVSTACYYIGPFPDGPEMLTFAVASFLAVARGQRLAAYLGTAAGLAVFGWAEFLVGPARVGRFVSVLAWVLVVLCAGEVSRYHRAYIAEARRRADEAERTREEEARRRATEERLRIARELHDVLAHKISLINVQAGAALHRREPEQAYTALSAIKDASKETLQELRTTLGVLRQVDEAGPLDPAPSLERLGDLIKRTKDAGLPVRLIISGARVGRPGRLPHRPGGAHQRRTSRGLGDGDRDRALRHRPCGRGGQRRRRGRRGRGGQRHPRHAGARGHPRRHARGRPAPGWRLPRTRLAAAAALLVG